MGWFSKNEKSEDKVPELPELPKLPALPEREESEPLHQLPSFPDSSLGSKFSQNAIKDAVAGRKEDDGGFDANDFRLDNEMETMPKPLNKPMKKEISPGDASSRELIPIIMTRSSPVTSPPTDSAISLRVYDK